MEEAYRAELVQGCAAAGDDAAFAAEAVAATAYWLIETTTVALASRPFRDSLWGISTIGQRLALRVALFAELAEETGSYRALAALLERLVDRLGVTDDEMPLYPAFGGPPIPPALAWEATSRATLLVRRRQSARSSRYPHRSADARGKLLRVRRVRRVAVIGCGGAGKSTLARQLGRRLGLPVVHLDEHYWHPGWRPTDPAAWRDLQERLVAADSWIIDGNYLSTLELRVSVADTVVLLDLPAWRCAWRASWRVVTGRRGANTAAGCAERLDLRHLRFLRYIWRFPYDVRPHLLDRLGKYQQTTEICRLATPAQVRRFAAGLGPGGLARHPPPRDCRPLTSRRDQRARAFFIRFLGTGPTT